MRFFSTQQAIGQLQNHVSFWFGGVYRNVLAIFDNFARVQNIASCEMEKVVERN